MIERLEKVSAVEQLEGREANPSGRLLRVRHTLSWMLILMISGVLWLLLQSLDALL